MVDSANGLRAHGDWYLLSALLFSQPGFRTLGVVEERQIVKARKVCVVRYIDDFVLCFRFRSDALRAQEALAKRVSKFSLTLEPTKTKLVEFGRYAHRHASKRGRKRPANLLPGPYSALHSQS